MKVEFPIPEISKAAAGALFVETIRNAACLRRQALSFQQRESTLDGFQMLLPMRF
ncbi:hypothetical protein [Noviherbaspirillum humi]|uniref:hypothetical protein n=1 Tax=Noviherbaspirillum humi TaxID=1688639 RepID=UPI0015961FDD|nr:hypothetical protein [Noviherbaspirillum humi]